MGNREDPGNHRLVSLHLLEGDRTTNPRNTFQEHKGQENHQEESGWLHQGEVNLTNLMNFYGELTNLVDEGKAVDIIYLDFMLSPHNTLTEKADHVQV